MMRFYSRGQEGTGRAAIFQSSGLNVLAVKGKSRCEAHTAAGVLRCLSLRWSSRSHLVRGRRSPRCSSGCKGRNLLQVAPAVDLRERRETAVAGVEVGMVEDIEKVHAKLNCRPLLEDLPVLVHGEVCVQESGSTAVAARLCIRRYGPDDISNHGESIRVTIWLPFRLAVQLAPVVSGRRGLIKPVWVTELSVCPGSGWKARLRCFQIEMCSGKS